MEMGDIMLCRGEMTSSGSDSQYKTMVPTSIAEAIGVAGGAFANLQ